MRASVDVHVIVQMLLPHEVCQTGNQSIADASAAAVTVAVGTDEEVQSLELTLRSQQMATCTCAHGRNHALNSL